MTRKQKFWMLVLIAAMLALCLACNDTSDGGGVRYNPDSSSYNVDDDTIPTGKGGFVEGLVDLAGDIDKMFGE